MRAVRTPERCRRPLLAVCGALLGLGLLPGCAAVHNRFEAGQYVGRPLSTHRAEGAQRLQSEIDVDPTVADYVLENGRPDYLYLESATKLYVFYLASDSAAMFDRPLPMASELTELGRIPGHLLGLLPKSEQQRVVAARSRAARRAQARGRSRRRAIARNAPAARDPGSAYIGAFPTIRIVERMRSPLTAADPGVSGWLRRALPDGTLVYTARVGSTRYEVRNDRIAFTVSLSRVSKSVPGSARLAMMHVNGAIFGAKAQAVTDRMMDLAVRAAADRTGRTSYAKRVEGRTIRIGRLVDAGVLAYSVHP